jgi:protease-4
MKQFLLTMAGVVAGLFIFFVGLPLLLIVIAASAQKPVASATVLELDLRRSLSDQDSQNPLAALGRRSLSVMSVIQTLRRAEDDTRVKGLLIRLPEGGISPGEADELRLAIRHFRKSGKPVFAHSQGLYPSGAVTSTYMVGASTGQLWMQPGASFEVAGLATEDMFFKRLFDKYGVKADYEQRYQYKNAVNPYLYDDYTPAHKEATLSWMGSIYDSDINAIAADRGRDPAQLKQAMEAGPHTAAEAQTLGLVDRVGQVKEAEDALTRQAGRDAKLTDFAEYASSIRGVDGVPGAPKIAVVYAEGPIQTGDGSGQSVLGSDQNIFSDQTADQIYDAIEDRDVKAIVFRVSSPGGVDTASEQILAAVRAAKAAGKPVVVSMGEYGASGGYWISSQASAIVAEPTTLTGSIGVYGGKLALGQTFAHFGVDLHQLTVGGPFAGAYSTGEEFTPEQRAQFSHSIDQVYDGFVQRVSSGRKLPVDRVRDIAKGRVWTGAQARGLGLVDQIGGFYDAVDKAKALAGLKGPVGLKNMTGPRTPFQAFVRALSGTSASLKSLTAAVQILSDPRAQEAAAQLSRARLMAEGADVLAPLPSWR